LGHRTFQVKPARVYRLRLKIPEALRQTTYESLIVKTKLSSSFLGYEGSIFSNVVVFF
jgi:hypothetical protein